MACSCGEYLRLDVNENKIAVLTESIELMIIIWTRRGVGKLKEPEKSQKKREKEK